jgi:sec-independent protein translocase protein TatA
VKILDELQGSIVIDDHDRSLFLNPSIRGKIIMDLGGPELFLILLALLVLFGGQKIPELARGLGKGISEFKKAQTDLETEFHKATETSLEATRSVGSTEKKS